MTEFFRIWTFFACLSLPPVLLLSFRALWASYLCLALPAIWFAIRERTPFRVEAAWAWCLLGFIAWFVLSSLWSPSGRAAGDSFEFVLAAVFGTLILRTSPPPVGMLAMGILGALTLVVIDVGTGNALRAWLPPEQPPGKDAVATARGLGLTLIMLPPALLFMHRSGRGGGRWRGVVLLAGLATSLTNVLAYGAVILSALVTSVGGALRPRIALRFLGTVWGAVMLMPFALAATLPPAAQLAQLQGLPDSIIHRLIIWRTVLDLWFEGRVLMGAGARATHTLTDKLGDVTLASGISLPQVSAHPHNIPIQLLFEFGLVGYGLAAATLLLGGKALLAQNWRKDMAAVIVALLAGLAVLVSIETDFWHLYFWCALVISLVTLRAVAAEQPR